MRDCERLREGHSGGGNEGRREKAGELGKKNVCVVEEKESGVVATSDSCCMCMKPENKKHIKSACMNDGGRINESNSRQPQHQPSSSSTREEQQLIIESQNELLE